MNIAKKYIKKIFKLTKKELEHHSNKYVLFTSLIEEFGELCAAIKIEKKIVLHKQIEEPAFSEAIDLFVCAVMMYYFATKSNNTNTFNNLTDEWINKIEIDDHLSSIAMISRSVGRIAFNLQTNKLEPIAFSAISISIISLKLFEILGGKDLKLANQIINKKLHKWETNQKKRV